MLPVKNSGVGQRLAAGLFVAGAMLCFYFSHPFPPKGVAKEKPIVSQDWPTFGGDKYRNMVNLVAKNVPTHWQVEDGKFRHIKWVADLGTITHSFPVVAGGRVFVGTNNGHPRDKNIKGPKAILMCFQEKDGKFLWQAVHEMPPRNIVDMALTDGLCSTPTVEGERVYYVTPACLLVCADTRTGKTVWSLDMMKQLDVYPCYIGLTSPLIVDNFVFVLTGNGVDAGTSKLMKPNAPSFVAVEKTTGKLVWESKLPSADIIEGQWSNPVYAKVKGQEQVIFPGGDCWLYGLEPKTGKLIWKFHCNLKKEVVGANPKRTPNYFMATPVVYKDRLYIGVGLHPEHPVGSKCGHFWCVDLVRATQNAKMNPGKDVSPQEDQVDPEAPVNKNSALAWHYGGEINPKPKFGRTAVFGRTMSTAAVHDGLVYIPEEYGYLHCLDAHTGQPYWVYDFKTGVWGSPLWVDNKIYLGTEDGDMYIFAHSKQKRIIDRIYMEEPIQSAPAVANGTLYVMTRTKLYAIGERR